MPLIAAVLVGVLGWFVAGIAFWAVFTMLEMRFEAETGPVARITPLSLVLRDSALRRFLIKRRQRIAARN